MSTRPLIQRWLAAALATVFVSLGSSAFAHKSSDAYARVSDGAQAGQGALSLSVALKDLDVALPTLDANNDRELTWGEVKAAQGQTTQLIAQHLQLRCADEPLRTDWQYQALEQRSDGVYLRTAMQWACAPQDKVSLHYSLLKGIDATHRLLLSGQARGQNQVAVLHEAKPGVLLAALPVRSANAAQPQPEPIPAAQSGWDVFKTFFPEGIHHIATGYDHLAFLLALLLPLRLWRSTQAPASGHTGMGLRSLLLTVTAFTLGHSITLVLATLGAGESPVWVEPVIALSIAFAAWLNLYPRPRLNPPALAMGFGLVHGLGFAGIMREAQVDGASLGWALAGFNLGVEAGQLVGVALWCVVSMLLHRWQHYERVVVRGSSWALMSLALFWTVQRVAG
jgi:HupE / UreJ protein